MRFKDILKKIHFGQKPTPEDADRQSEIADMYARTREKCRKNHGDPFADYRRSGQLPDHYEYGMNCFLDSTFETSGLEVVQAVYEEIKKDPKLYCIYTGTSTYNLPGIPILLGIARFGDAIDAHNRAVIRLRQKEPPAAYQVLAKELRLSVLQHSKSDHEAIIKLGILSMGAMALSAWGPEGMSPSDKKVLRYWGKAIEETVSSMDKLNGLSALDMEKVMLAADPGITRLLANRDNGVRIEDALFLTSTHFWNIILGSIVWEFPTELKAVNEIQFPWNRMDFYLDSYNISHDQVLKWQESIHPTNTSRENIAKVWHAMTGKIRGEHELLESSVSDDREARTELVSLRGKKVHRIMLCLLLRLLGQKGPMMNSLLALDQAMSEDLFNIVAEEFIGRREWYESS